MDIEHEQGASRVDARARTTTMDAGKRGRCRLRALGKHRSGSSVGNLAIQPLLATYMCISHLFCPSGSCEYSWNNDFEDATHATVLFVTSLPASPSAASFVTLSALTQGPDGHLQLVNNWVVSRDRTHRQQHYCPLSAMTGPFRHFKLKADHAVANHPCHPQCLPTVPAPTFYTKAKQ